MELEIKPGVKELPKTTILEEREGYIRSRSEYSNGLILLFEVTEEGTKVCPNYNLIQQSDGSFTPNFSSPNQSFIDEK